MDLRLDDYDLFLENGELEFVTGGEAIRQDIEMRLRTWLGETPYDRSAGVPYLQIIFKRGTTLDAVNFILEQIVRDTPGVEEVLDFKPELDTKTRVLTVTGRARTIDGEIDFSALAEQI